MNARAVVPDFELPATGNPRFRLPAFHGHPLIPRLHSIDPAPGFAAARVGSRHLRARCARRAAP